MAKQSFLGRPQAGIALALAVTLAVGLIGYLVLFWPPEAPRSSASEPPADPYEQVKAEVEAAGLERLVVYGHSMPLGGGASRGNPGYTELAAEATGLELDNRAVGGTLAAASAETMTSSSKVGPRDVVVVHTGMNDIFRRGIDAATKGRAVMEELVAGASRAGRTVLVLECQPTSWDYTPPARAGMQAEYDAWNDMVREVAAASSGVEVLDTCEQWDPTAFTKVNRYHPNDEGHAHIAEGLTALLAG